MLCVPSRLHLVFVVALLSIAPAPAADRPLTKVEIAKLGKAATALVEVKEARAYGTAFCIHSSGLFLTTEHVIHPANEGPITLILHPGLKKQKIFQAKIVRRDKKLDLALLRAEDAKDLSTLSLGTNENLAELMEVVALGFPFGKSLIEDKSNYPAISINHGHVTALHHREGRLHRIQLDAVLNPGNSGGPVLDARGHVVGIVVAGVRGSGVNFAIPVDDVRRFAYQPNFQFVLPFVTRENMHTSALFKVRVTSLVPPSKPLDLELTLTAGDGKDRKFKMEHDKNGYQVKAIPVPIREGPLTFPMTVEYDKASLTGSVTDQAFKVGGKEHKLSEVRSLRFKPEAQVTLVNGKIVKGAISGLDGLAVRISEDAVRVNLTKVVTIRCEAPGESDAVACTVIARQDGKEVGRGGDSIAIGGIPRDEPTVASGPAVGPISSPRLDQDKVVRPLPSTIGDLAVGGGGRFLILSLPKVRKLAVFDVSAGCVVKYIPVEEEDVKFAAGQDRFVVFLPKTNVIQRWSLATFERERSMPLPIREQPTTLAMGSASQGPLLVGTTSRIAFLDLHTLKVLDIQMPDNRPMGMSESTHVRASADSKVFGVWHCKRSPQGLETLILIGHQLQAHYEHQSAGHVTPGPDGKVIFTGRGLYSPTLKPRKNDNDGGADYGIPAAHGPLYLSINTSAKNSCSVHMVGNAGPLARLTKLDIPEGLTNGDCESFGADRRLHLIPSAKLIVTIPTSNDRLILHRFDLLEALKKADVDYLLVMSQPPAVAKKGETLTYPLAVMSRKGGVTYRLESGPKGMAISPKGLLKWSVPAKTEETEVSVILVVADSAGQEVFHIFTLLLMDKTPSVKPPMEKTPPVKPSVEKTSPATPDTPPSANRPKKLVKKLPGTIANLAVGGGGHYLILHLAREHKLAIFDVKKARIARYITLTDDNVKFTAGQDKIVVVLPDTSVVQRWDIATGERDLAVPLAFKGTVKSVCMGSASQGPILVGIDDGHFPKLNFLNLRSLKPEQIKMPERGFLSDLAFVRASADGKTFTTWSPNTSPQGVNVLVVTGGEARAFYQHDSAGHLDPSPDGKVIYTARGLWTAEAKRKDAKDNSYCIPAHQGDLYLSLELPGLGGRGKQQTRVSVYMPGDPPRRVVTLTDIEVPTGITPWDREVFGFDRRFHFLPTDGWLITIPTSGDKVVLHRFDLLDALEKSGTDYLIVTSLPMTQANKGASYAYQIVAKSNKGGLKYRLDSGPKGMEVSATGLVKWTVPADLGDKEVDVIVNIRDSSGQEVFHTYKVGIAASGTPAIKSKERDSGS